MKKVYKFLGRADGGSSFIFDSRKAAKKSGCHTITRVWRINNYGWNTRFSWWYDTSNSTSWLMPSCGVKWRQD